MISDYSAFLQDIQNFLNFSNLNEKFDLFHIDGTHKLEFVNKEFQMCKHLSSSNIMNVIFDDYDNVTEMKNIINRSKKLVFL